jgi:hypothetical protein
MIMVNSLHPKYSDVFYNVITLKINPYLPARYPQLQGKIEAYNKIVKNEFLGIENISNREEGKRRYSMFVKAYNETREHGGGINGHTPSEMFLMKGRLNSCKNIKTIKQIKSVTHVGK